jgi:hypothetical protein
MQYFGDPVPKNLTKTKLIRSDQTWIVDIKKNWSMKCDIEVFMLLKVEVFFGGEFWRCLVMWYPEDGGKKVLRNLVKKPLAFYSVRKFVTKLLITNVDTIS